MGGWVEQIIVIAGVRIVETSESVWRCVTYVFLLTKVIKLDESNIEMFDVALKRVRNCQK